MPAHVVVLDYGPAAACICAACNLNTRYPRTKPAQEAARHHNATTHDKDQPHD
jgi:hypothetical protein